MPETSDTTRDLAIIAKGLNGGGNCPLSDADKTVVKHGVTLIGETNLPALVSYC